MGIRIVYSEIASRDLREIYDFIRRGSLFYAKKEVSDIRNFAKKLKQDAFLGRKFADEDNELIRALIFKNYNIIYEIVLRP